MIVKFHGSFAALVRSMSSVSCFVRPRIWREATSTTLTRLTANKANIDNMSRRFKMYLDISPVIK